MNFALAFGQLIATAGPTQALPAPYWLLTALHWLTLLLHLLAMNLLLGFVLVLLFARRNPAAGSFAGTAAKLLPVLLAATITLGVAPLLFLQAVYGQFFYSASIVSAWNWFLLIPVLIATYYLCYALALRSAPAGKARWVMPALVTIGLVYVSFTLTMVSDLAEKPQLWSALYLASPAGLSLNPNFGETLFRWTHTLAGAIAVAGLGIQLFALYHPKYRSNRELLAWGGKVFIMAAAKATILALIYLWLIDRAVLAGFLASPGLHAILTATVLTTAAVALTLRARRAEHPAPMVLASAGLTFLSAGCMVAGRHFLRLVCLGERFDPAGLAVAPQWGPLAMFLATFLIGLAVLSWMLRRYFATPSRD